LDDTIRHKSKSLNVTWTFTAIRQTGLV